VGALSLGLLGLVGLVVVGILAAKGRIPSRLTVQPGNSGIYAETFAIWMVLFLFGDIVWRIVAHMLFPQLPSMWLNLMAFASSLLALLWPVWRGIPWRTVRQEIGWTSRHPLREILWGVAWYAMSLPFLVVGFLLSQVLFWIRDQASGGSG